MTTSHETSQRDDLRHLPAPVLRSDLLSRVHELNCDYLELLATERPVDEGTGQLQYLTPRLKAGIADLSLEHRSRLAAAPYALYSLRFEDVRFWQATCSTLPRRIDERYLAGAGGSSIQAPFVEVALIHAWHVANAHPLAARVLYSMCAAVRERIARMPLWQVKRVGAEHGSLMKPRWPANPCFWPDLIAFAKSGDSVRLAATQLLGTQLIAAELAASSRAAK